MKHLTCSSSRYQLLSNFGPPPPLCNQDDHGWGHPRRFSENDSIICCLSENLRGCKLEDTMVLSVLHAHGIDRICPVIFTEPAGMSPRYDL